MSNKNTKLMENKFILSVRFRGSDGIFTYSHYVLDTQYLDKIDLHNFSCLRNIPEVLISDDTFEMINAIACFHICNNAEV